MALEGNTRGGPKVRQTTKPKTSPFKKSLAAAARPTQQAGFAATTYSKAGPLHMSEWHARATGTRL